MLNELSGCDNSYTEHSNETLITNTSEQSSKCNVLIHLTVHLLLAHIPSDKVLANSV